MQIVTCAKKMCTKDLTMPLLNGEGKPSDPESESYPNLFDLYPLPNYNFDDNTNELQHVCANGTQSPQAMPLDLTDLDQHKNILWRTA